ncbi:THUMP domain-containing protein 1-like [Panonychus citri]|uniref:THUMP domain-containing protein 1-like n=1 Tax=Panonychus citri TaxID=50023 RepID=UPI002307DFD0|nr:THUMP domain-containing protein 1-like [Panonychus citri]
MSGARSGSSRGSGIKRKKNYYKQCGGKRTKFTPFKEGVKGFLVTCNKSENHAVSEAFFLLNKYADELEKLNKPEIGEESVGSHDDKSVEVKEEKVDEVTVKEEELEVKVKEEDVDLEVELKKEVDKMKESRNRFSQLTTKTHNVVFIEAKEPSLQPNSLVDLVFNEIKSNSNFGVRYCLKILPVLMTCGAYTETIKKTFISLLENQPESASYYIIPKVRANNSITREEIIEAICEACSEKRPSWTPDFEDAKLTIVVNIVNKNCCLSILENFNSFKKYNPVELTIALGNNITKGTKANAEPETKTDPKGRPKGAGGPRAKGKVKTEKTR